MNNYNPIKYKKVAPRGEFSFQYLQGIKKGIKNRIKKWRREGGEKREEKRRRRAEKDKHGEGEEEWSGAKDKGEKDEV